MTELNINPQPISILFTHYGDNWIRGSERCLLDLLAHLDKAKFTAVLWCNQQIMVDQAHKLGIEVYRSDFPLLLGWKAPRFDFPAFIGLVKQALKLIDKHQIKLIHANSAAPCQWLNFAARKRNTPLICHLHSIYQLRDRLTLGLHQVPMLIGVSRYVLGELQRDKMPDARMQVIANGIDTQKLLAQKKRDLRQTLAINPGDFVLATVGSLIKRKGVDLIIAALAQLRAKQLPVHLLIIGEGPEKKNLKQQIQRLGLQQNVTLLGEQENVIAILRGSADLFVSAAREEAFGLVLAEASIAQLAIVAPAIGGISDVVLDGQSGTLVPSEDVDALSKAIHTLYLCPARCHAMGKAGREHVLRNFSIEQNTRHFEQLYKQMVSNGNNCYKNIVYKNSGLRLSLSNIYKRLCKKGAPYAG
ncbi:MAG: glycosyltransferase involved in cell wall biosynthesis [Psychromonas sp.]|jgi:glycosyltransferase involved in cell wall biosynthesis|uniref:glycosyltransferase family 4 protein n=1 Tax=Psychromonas sp. TaxID=1884585 RepID=UPI0039E66B58